MVEKVIGGGIKLIEVVNGLLELIHGVLLVIAEQWRGFTFGYYVIIGVKEAEATDGVEFELFLINFFCVVLIRVTTDGFPFTSGESSALHFEIHHNTPLFYLEFHNFNSVQIWMIF
jgi:hypothetical protein